MFKLRFTDLVDDMRDMNIKISVKWLHGNRYSDVPMWGQDYLFSTETNITGILFVPSIQNTSYEIGKRVGKTGEKVVADQCDQLSGNINQQWLQY